jgi:hypothetical protein
VNTKIMFFYLAPPLDSDCLLHAVEGHWGKKVGHLATFLAIP